MMARQARVRAAGGLWPALVAVVLMVLLAASWPSRAVAQTPGLDAFAAQLETPDVDVKELSRVFGGLSPFEKGLALSALEKRMTETKAAGDERNYKALDFFHRFLPKKAIRRTAKQAGSERSAVVFGVVTGEPDGAPVAGARIASGTYRATSAADGSFRLELYPGRHEITVTRSPRYGPLAEQLFLLPDQRREVNPVLQPAEGASDLGRIAGVLVDEASGAPLKSATVLMTSVGDILFMSKPKQAISDEEGRFVFEDVPPGEAVLVLNPFAQGKDYYAANGNRLIKGPPQVTVQVAQGETATPRISVATVGPEPVKRTVTVAGVIRDLVTGAPVADASVFIGRKSASSGPDGAFRVRQISSRSPRVVVDHPDYLEARRDLGKLDPGIHKIGDILLQPAGTGNLEGRVLAADTGQPLPGVTVTSGEKRVTSGANGAFAMLGLEAGGATATATLARYRPATVALTIAEGETINQEIMLEPIVTGRLAGVVRDAQTGAPLPGANLTIGKLNLKSGADGRFETPDLQKGVATVAAALDGYHPARQQARIVAAETVETIIELEPITTGTLNLAVLDAQTGAPLPGAAVRLGEREAKADATGRAIFADVPAGTHLARAALADYADGSLSIDIPRAAEVSAELRLEPILTGTVTGRVISAADGTPVEGAEITAADARALSDARGAFAFEGLIAGPIRLNATAPLFEPARAAVELARNRTAEVTIEMQPITHGDVVGRVIDAATGKPLPGARVSIGEQDILADAAGAFAFRRIEAGDLLLRAQAKRYEPGSLSARLEPAGQLELTIELTPLTHGDVTGRVVDARTGKPLPGARVSIGQQETLADASGTFALQQVRAGDLRVAARAEGYDPGSAAAQLEPGDRLDLTLELEPIRLGSLSGRIVDSQTGEPIAGALVTLDGQTAETDANGVYRFTGLKPGPANLQVQYPGYRTGSDAGQVRGGDDGKLDIALSVREETPDEIAQALGSDGAIDLYGIYFDVNQDRFKPQSLPTLRALKAFLAANAGKTFIIEGHTDSDGSDAYNQDLSERRAASVLKWLAENGIDIDNIRAVGMGETAPVASNATRAGKALNRRVVLRRAEAP